MQEVLFVQDIMEIQEVMDTVDIVDSMDSTTIYSFSAKTEGKKDA